jgi:hypothetical protein
MSPSNSRVYQNSTTSAYLVFKVLTISASGENRTRTSSKARSILSRLRLPLSATLADVPEVRIELTWAKAQPGLSRPRLPFRHSDEML